MKLTNASQISSFWGIQVKESKVLLERATHIKTNDEQKFILKKKGITQEVKREIKLLKQLDNKIITQYPIATSSGEFFATYKEDNYCLYYFLKGKPFDIKEALDNPEVPRLLGETIALMNKLMSNFDRVEDFPDKKNLYKMVYGYAVKEIVNADECGNISRILEDLEESLKEHVGNLPTCSFIVMHTYIIFYFRTIG
ncbi:hypothetical protein [Bacillus sp. FJAT-27445]|uniref:hypothetical protein n=1 Tax=Bacillus sp. FJAT-27445 TaxID=1679166 RepID=UPI000743EB32|nr:hypothetical protein [Bacillus sp. FJAT-27445]